MPQAAGEAHVAAVRGGHNLEGGIHAPRAGTC